MTGFDATWILLGLAGLFIGYGLWRGATRPTGGLPAQTIAMVGFGAVAAVALVVNGDFGAYLVAVGLLAHAACLSPVDQQGRGALNGRVCFVLDTLLAIAIIVATMQG